MSLSIVLEHPPRMEFWETSTRISSRIFFNMKSSLRKEDRKENGADNHREIATFLSLDHNIKSDINIT